MPLPIPEPITEAPADRHRDISSLSAVIDMANTTIADGRFDVALRYADRAWRLSPQTPLVCQILMTLLLKDGNANRALQVFAKLEPRHVDADLAALHVDALRLSGDWDAASAALGTYLACFAIERDGALAKAADALMAERAQCGWVGVTPDLKLTGHIPAPAHAEALVLELRSPGGKRETVSLAVKNISTHLSELRAVNGLTIKALGTDIRLIGSSIALPANFGLNGIATIKPASISGSVSLAWSPTLQPKLLIEKKSGPQPVILLPDDEAPGSWRFELPFGTLDRLTGASFALSVALPDGKITPFPGSPISLAPVKPYRASKKAKRHTIETSGTAIVIPVYRGAEETRACVTSVLETVPADAPVILVNDASPEAAITELMREHARNPRITVITNERNLGFPGAANRGMAAAPDHDVILLNSDTLVFPGWYERLTAHAALDTTIATVTPLSNAGSIASYPGGEESACTEAMARLRDEAAAAANAGQHVDAPTGVGFCLFVRRACLAQVGAFDEQLFGRGYGEENDFCMRASAHGWRHVIAGDVYVLHRNGTSFGSTRNGWMARNEAILDQRHPSYKALVTAFHKEQPLAPLRRQIDIAVLRDNKRPIALLVSLALAGGVAKHVEARIAALEHQGYQPILLRPDADHKQARLTLPGHEEFQDLTFRADDGIEAFRSLLDALPIEHVELHHFLGLDAPFVDACLALNAPTDIFIHDYSWYCPRLSLLGANGTYCGEPGAAACQSCIVQNGSELHDRLDPDSLKERSDQWLRRARHIFVPCEDVAQRYRRMFSGVPFTLARWEDTPLDPRPIANPTPHRVAIIGAVGEQKGRAVLLACARHAALHDLPLEFVLIGFADEEEALLATGKVFITGRYDEAELPDLLQREAPSAIFLPSVTPETWSYSLSHAMATGLPIVAFDLGAIAERLRRSASSHHLLPLDTQAAQINELLMGNQPEETQRDTPAPRPTTTTASGLPEISLTLHTPKGSIMRDPGKALTSTAEFLTLARGLYHFSVMPSGEAAAGQVPMLPALQIVTAPGQQKNAVEYVSAPGSEHQWLRSAQDSVILKVNNDSVKVVVMSLTAPGLSPLHIDVRKLDGEQAATAFADSAPQQPIIAPGQPPVAAPGAALLRAQIVAHVEYMGDVIGMDQSWVGAPEGDKAIECLSITPMTNIAPAAIEYKTLSASGAETPWTDQGRPCGTRGRATPLLGFAIRQRPDAAARFACEYSARFASGRIVGPMRDGALCVSPLANDRLVNVWVNITDHAAQHPAMSAMPMPAMARTAQSGPRFSSFREVGV
ncbi:MAG: glycosyltransferase [Sphingomonadaceae bacterium]